MDDRSKKRLLKELTYMSGKGESCLWVNECGDGWHAGFSSELAAYRVSYSYKKAKIGFSDNLGCWFISV